MNEHLSKHGLSTPRTTDGGSPSRPTSQPSGEAPRNLPVQRSRVYDVGTASSREQDVALPEVAPLQARQSSGEKGWIGRIRERLSPPAADSDKTNDLRSIAWNGLINGMTSEAATPDPRVTHYVEHGWPSSDGPTTTETKPDAQPKPRTEFGAEEKARVEAVRSQLRNKEPMVAPSDVPSEPLTEPQVVEQAKSVLGELADTVRTWDPPREAVDGDTGAVVKNYSRQGPKGQDYRDGHHARYDVSLRYPTADSQAPSAGAAHVTVPMSGVAYQFGVTASATTVNEVEPLVSARLGSTHSEAERAHETNTTATQDRARIVLDLLPKDN